MRCVMMGTGPFAVPLFRVLHSRHDVPVLVTRPSVAGPSRGELPPIRCAMRQSS